jgi:hypothetical protein
MIRGFGLIALLVAPVALSPAQQVPTKSLGPREVEFPAQWINVVGVRELRDGRVVVLDARDQALKLVDFKSGKAAMIGHKGSGPGEYQLPLLLVELPADSTAVFDMANSGTPMIVTPQGTAGGVLPGEPAGGFLQIQGQTDGRGRIYRLAGTPNGEGLFAIERLDRGDGRRDTVTFASRRVACSASASPPANPTPLAARGRGDAGMRAAGTPVPFLSFEQWAVASDSRLAIVCPDPYHVSFITPIGKRTSGPTIPYDRIPVTNAEKQQWRDERGQPVASIRVDRGGQTTSGYVKAGAVAEPEKWPDVLPPFVLGRSSNLVATFTPDGMLWVRRAASANASPLVDVIGRDGRLAYHVTLPKRTRLVGFGANSIYLVRIDDDDIEYLQRYRLPR